jgi:hypothetical protein
VKELTGSARASVAASPEACLAFLAAVDRYPTWYPEVVRAVDVVERAPSGQPTRAQTKLHLAQGPLTKDFDLLMAVSVEPPGTVRLTRIAHGSSDAERFEVTWHIDAAAHTEISLDLRANLSVPRLLPIGGIGDSVANGFVSAAARDLAAQ